MLAIHPYTDLAAPFLSFRVLGFRVWGLGFGVWGLGLGFIGPKFGDWGFECRPVGHEAFGVETYERVLEALRSFWGFGVEG